MVGFGSRRKPMEAGIRRERFQERIQVAVLHQVQVLPIVHPCASKRAIQDPKSQRVNQMKLKPIADAESGNVSRIGGDLGLNQDDA